jgi:RNA polymerase sigma-70 factor (ECF subfamily)
MGATQDGQPAAVPVHGPTVTMLRMARMTEPAARAAFHPAAALVHADALHNLARYLTRSGTDAEDLVQETYAHAFAASDRFEAGTNMKAWLFRILRNLFLDRMRRERRTGDDVVEAADAAHAAEADDAWLRGDLELEAMRHLVGAEIEAALRALSEESRTVVLLDLEDFTEAEIAAVLGCAAGTVKSRLSRARAALRQRLAEYAGRNSP